MKKEWTIIFLIYANYADVETDDLRIKFKNEQEKLLNTLSSLLLNDKCELLTIINNILFEKQADPAAQDTIVIERYVTNANGQTEKQVLETVSSPFMLQKSDTLGKIFEKIHNDQFKYNGVPVQTSAKKYFLNTFDHGSAFGIFKSQLQPQQFLAENFAFNAMAALQNATNETIINSFTPKNIIYTFAPGNKEKVTIVTRERFWDKEIKNYSIPKLNLQFELSASDKKKEALIKLLDSKLLTDQLSIRKKDNTILFSAPDKTKNLNLWHEQGFLGEEHVEALEQGNDNADDNIAALEADCEKKADYLTNEELADAISAGFGTVDCLLMMNCLMMNLHTSYALKDSVKFLVAPQGSIDEPGYNYREILNTLLTTVKNNTPIQPETLSKLCVASLRTFQSVTTPDRETIEKWAVFSFNLLHIEPIAELVNKVADYINSYAKQPQFESIKTTAQNAIRDTYNFEGEFDYEQTDITHFLREILKNTITGTPFYNSLYDYLQQLYIFRNKMLGIEHWSGLVYEDMEANQKAAYPPMGLSIYLPEQLFPNECLFIQFIHSKSLTQSRLLKDKENWVTLLKTLSK